MKKILGFIIVFFVLIGFGVSFIYKLPLVENQQVLKSEIGKVLKIDYVDIAISSQVEDSQVKQIVTVELLSGPFKGQKTEIDNILTQNPYYDIKLEKGNKVILHTEKVGNDIEYFISDVQRTPAVIFLAMFFCALLILVGRKKGFFSVLSIVITCFLIFSVLVPMVLAGISPIFSSIVVAIASTIGTMYLIGGTNAKSTSAIIGTTLSLVFAGVFSLFAVSAARLTGFASEEDVFLFSAYPNLDFIEILISTIILSALGAVMDVAMSISSTVNELLEANPNMSAKDLIKSGMNVGRDIIGTMANTLILVYVGGALPLVLLSQNIDLQKFFNLNQVVTEITAALIGSMSLVICVPLTAFVAAYLIKNAQNQKYMDDTLSQTITTNSVIDGIMSLEDDEITEKE